MERSYTVSSVHGHGRQAGVPPGCYSFAVSFETAASWRSMTSRASIKDETFDAACLGITIVIPHIF